ncbi:pseudouridine synthase [Candidatus Vidania fulgoroideorum]
MSYQGIIIFKSKTLALIFKKRKIISSELKIKNFIPRNRLDYEVPGLLVFVKKKNKNIFIYNKMYYAFVFGNFYSSNNIISICNFRISILKLQYIIYIKKLGISLIRIKLITGRRNQIRKQLKLIGFPIVMDKKYGCFLLNKVLSRKTNLKELQLFSYSLETIYENNCSKKLDAWQYLKKELPTLKEEKEDLVKN